MWSKKPVIDVPSTTIMLPKIVKRGRPKGSEMTIIGLTSKKKKLANKTQKVVKPFSKIKTNRKR